MANGFPAAAGKRNLWAFLHWLYDQGFGNGGLGLFSNLPGQSWYVDTVNGDDTSDGKSWETAFATMAQAFTKIASSDRIFVRGNVREQISTPVNIFDVTVIGVGNTPRNSDAVTGYFAQTSATWRGPASPAAATPLLIVRQQGWAFVNILFNAPTDAAAVQLLRNADSGADERDASHATFQGCRFTGGNTGIQDNGGCYNVHVYDCFFNNITDGTGRAIHCSSTAVANPLSWHIKNCRFMNNDNHVVAAASAWVIEDSVFSAVSVTSKIDFTGGVATNTVVRNALGGTYSIAGGYTAAGAGDEWGGNFNSIAGGVTAADPA